MLDLSASFDTIDHSILIKRLASLGFGGTVKDWFISYLVGRTQSISIDNVTSDPIVLEFGVPQGSVLGPILYTLYTTPLGTLIRKHGLDFHMYADDTQIYLSIDAPQLQNEKCRLESCLDDIKIWMLSNKLKLNDDKTELIVCNPRNFDFELGNILIGDQLISPSSNARNLGVVIDDKLCFSDHISQMSRSIYLDIRRLRQASKYLNQSSLKTLASSFINSRLDYCNALYFNISNYQIGKLQKLQNFAAKTILNKSLREHVTPCLITLHWLPVRFRIKYKIAILVYKCLNNLAPEYLSDIIKPYTPSRSLRSSNANLLTPQSTHYKTLGDRSFSVAAPTVWNDLPLSLRQSESLNIFKQNLKTHLFSICFY